MKILYLTSSPLHKMHIIDLYINEIRSAFDVEIWDVSSVFGGKGKSDFQEIPCIASINEFAVSLDLICRKQKVVVITNILIYDLHVVYKELRSRKIPIISIDKESIIFWMKDLYGKEHPDSLSKAERNRLRIKAFPLLRQVYSYLEYQHSKFDYVLGAYNYFPDACRHFYHIHNLKYDEYLHTEEKERVVDEKYILFMDAGLAHLPSHEGKANAIDKQEYLDTMKAFFERVENQFGLPIIIAAHPKSGYQEKDFGERRIILYKTPELMKYAEFVLAHYSTSLIELVLQKKKVAFLYAEDYMLSDSRTVLETASEYARMLDASFIDIRKMGTLTIKFNEKAYDNFINQYIINKEAEKFSNGELIIKFLKGLER